MDIYWLQKIYRTFENRNTRFLMLKAAQFLRLRTLLVRIDLNNFCNLRCIMCSHAHAPIKGANRIIMALADFENIAEDIFPKTRSLHLSCGSEPLLVKHFDHCLELSKRYRIPFVSYATNGMLLDERICRVMITSQIDEIIVSADGATPETLESIRVRAKFHKLLENIALLDRMKKEAGSGKPVLRMNYTFMDKNVTEILDFIKLFSSKGMRILELRPVKMSVLTGLGNHPHLLTADGIREYHNLFPRIQQACAHHGIALIALPRVPEMNDATANGPDGAQPNHKDSNTVNTCILPWFSLYINSDGSFKPCVGGPIIGNLISSRYSEVFQSDSMQSFLTQTEHPNQFCGNCELKGEIIG